MYVIVYVHFLYVIVYVHFVGILKIKFLWLWQRQLSVLRCSG